MSKCINDNCKNTAKYNLSSETNVLYCIEHKTFEMIHIKSIKCNKFGCLKKPSYNLPTEKSVMF
jgi:hypothetical protein